MAGLSLAGVGIATAVALIVVGGARFVDLLVLAGLLASLTAPRATLAVQWTCRARQPAQPVLFFNPRSGGGKAERFNSPTARAHVGSNRSTRICPSRPASTSRRSCSTRH